MSETAFALLYAALWALLFFVLFRLGSRSKDLQRTIRQIKKNLHSGWPDPEE
ncbi:MAG TPA: hypothetical protein VG799_08525 [Gemmatimonadota bacterium]|jgi:hypothetical protein|nr:hypothetical protein [Gemmatimonadota bacterium]